jgi:predicted DCC family thiol-disulfide oxidoreductase YuxK
MSAGSCSSFELLTDALQSLRWLTGRWTGALFAGAPAAELGFHRILFFGAVLFYSFVHYGDAIRWPEVADVLWSPTALFRILHLPVLPAAGLLVVLWVWRLSLAFALVGLFTRASACLAVILGFYIVGLPHNFGKINHNDAIVVIGLAIFALSRCGDAWSVDGMLRHAPDDGDVDAGSSGHYPWPLTLCRLMLALILFAAGVAKLRSPGFAEWVLTDNLTNLLIAHHYTHYPPSNIGLLLARYPWTGHVLAASTIAIELVAPIAAFASLRIRTVLAANLVAMLVGFWIMLGVLFAELTTFLVIFFFPWREVAIRLDRSSVGPRLTVLFDGSCGLCIRTVAVIQHLDVLGRIEVSDVLRDWDRLARRWPALSQQACLETMHVVTPSGRVSTGFYGYRAMAWHLPLGWLLLPLLFAPGVPAVGQRVYALIARRRYASGCPLPPPG